MAKGKKDSRLAALRCSYFCRGGECEKHPIDRIWFLFLSAFVLLFGYFGASFSRRHISNFYLWNFISRMTTRAFDFVFLRPTERIAFLSRNN